MLNDRRMTEMQKAQWVLRIAVAGEFVGHGMFALQGKAQWVGWVGKILGTDPALSAQILLVVGFVDLCIAAVVLLKPIRIVLLWAAIWGFWTAILRPIVGESFWDFIERWGNWGAPLALLLLRGWPKSKEWFR